MSDPWTLGVVGGGPFVPDSLRRQPRQSPIACGQKKGIEHISRRRFTEKHPVQFVDDVLTQPG